MTLVLGFALLAASAIVLALGAELFAENAAPAGRRLGVTALAVGLVVAGAEPEELVTAALASAHHQPGVAAGDAVGANVTMLTIVLGLIAVVAGFSLSGRVRGYAFVASFGGVLSAVLVSDGELDRVEAVVLVVAYLALVAAIWRIEHEPPAFGELAETLEDTDAAQSRRRIPAVILVLLGVGLMIGGGALAVAGAEHVVDQLGLAGSAVGLTFVALATTAELFALAWSALRRGVGELAIAGVVGSAAYNSTATLGVAGLVRPLHTHGVTGAAWLAAALPLAVVLFGGRGAHLGRVAGGVLVATYVVYVTVVLT